MTFVSQEHRQQTFSILIVSLVLPACFNRQITPCHPLPFGWRAAGLFGMLGLLSGAVIVPIGAAAERLPSIQSRETRLALLSLFDQVGAGLGPPSDSTRSRPNRRGPDVGYIADDPICISCVMTVLGPPALPPAEPRKPAVPRLSTLSIPPVTPAPKPASKPVKSQPPVSKPPAHKPPERKPSIVASRSEIPPVVPKPEPLPGDPPLFSGQAPVQTPGPLPLLGLGAAFGFSRRLRRRLKCVRRQGLR